MNEAATPNPSTERMPSSQLRRLLREIIVLAMIVDHLVRTECHG